MQLQKTLQEIHTALQIPATTIKERNLLIYEEARLEDLVVATLDLDGRTLVLSKDAAKAWNLLAEAAESEGIILRPFSGFRSYRYQEQLIRKQLEKGREIEEILQQMAVPGCSEHHTGCAVDLTTEGAGYLDENLENTAAFAWLKKNAQKYHFYMSYPRDNAQGYIYEPWHWCYRK